MYVVAKKDKGDKYDRFWTGDCWSIDDGDANHAYVYTTVGEILRGMANFLRRWPMGDLKNTRVHEVATVPPPPKPRNKHNLTVGREI